MRQSARMQFPNHPARLAAIATGALKWSGPDCPDGHGTLRHVSSGQCVECNRIRSRERARRKAAAQPPRVNIADDPARLAALAAGGRFFMGKPCRHGHDGRRYMRSMECVGCGRARTGV